MDMVTAGLRDMVIRGPLQQGGGFGITEWSAAGR